MTLKSSPAKQAWGKRYYEAHRDRLLATCNLYNREHREERAAYYTSYRASHREEIRAQQAAYNADHKAEAAAYYANVVKPREDDRRAFLEKAKSGVGCADCESTEMLDFHHRDKATKKYQVSLMLRMPWSEIMTEVWKCDVLCRSCHTKRHRAEDRLLVV